MLFSVLFIIVFCVILCNSEFLYIIYKWLVLLEKMVICCLLKFVFEILICCSVRVNGLVSVVNCCWFIILCCVLLVYIWIRFGEIRLDILLWLVKFYVIWNVVCLFK